MFGSSTDEVTPCGKSQYGQRSMDRSGRNETTSYEAVSPSSSCSNRGDGASSGHGALQPTAHSGGLLKALYTNITIMNHTTATMDFILYSFKYQPSDPIPYRTHYYYCYWSRQYIQRSSELASLINQIHHSSPQVYDCVVKVEDEVDLMLWN